MTGWTRIVTVRRGMVSGRCQGGQMDVRECQMDVRRCQMDVRRMSDEGLQSVRRAISVECSSCTGAECSSYTE